MQFKLIFLFASLSSVVIASAIDVPSQELGIFPRDAAPMPVPEAEASAEPTFWFGGGGCGWWNPFCGLSLSTYQCGGISFNVFSQWGSACNMVQFGQLWTSYSSSVWSSQSSLSYEHIGAFAQSGFQLCSYASYNAQAGWYGTSKTNFAGFCNELKNNHWTPKQSCSKDQWEGYKRKWSIDDTKPCRY